MPRVTPSNTFEAIDGLKGRTGSGLFYQGIENLEGFDTWIAASRISYNYKPFVISIFDMDRKQDEVTLYMMVNPSDITVGQTYNSSAQYTRTGWISSLWGNNQATIIGNGSTPGFYYFFQGVSEGITNFSRRNSVSLINLMSLVAMFRNNGQYYMDSYENPNIFRDFSRVINVMDIIKISYDGSDYYGSFTTFSLNDIAENPYRMDYTIEFMVSCFGEDFDKIEGHTKKSGNEINNKVSYFIQGQNIDFNEVVMMDEDELKKYFKPDRVDPYSYEAIPRGNAEDNTLAEGKKGRIGTGNSRWLNKVSDVGKYLDSNPDVDKAIEAVAKEMGMSKELIIGIIDHESAHTWSPIVDNIEGSATGILQIIDSTAIEISKKLLVDGKITQDEYDKVAQSLKPSVELCTLPGFDTTAEQVYLLPYVAKATYVSVPKTETQAAYRGSLYGYMKTKTTVREKEDTYMIGHFYPKYIGKSLDEPLPAEVAKKNRVGTTGEYIKVTRNTVKVRVSKKS